jgi:hypothetical protein
MGQPLATSHEPLGIPPDESEVRSFFFQISIGTSHYCSKIGVKCLEPYDCFFPKGGKSFARFLLDGERGKKQDT